MTNVTGTNMPGGVQNTGAHQTPAGSEQSQQVSSEDADHFAGLMAPSGNALPVSIGSDASQALELQQAMSQISSMDSAHAGVAGMAQQLGLSVPAPGQSAAEYLQQLFNQQQAAGQTTEAESLPAGPAGPAQHQNDGDE